MSFCENSITADVEMMSSSIQQHDLLRPRFAFNKNCRKLAECAVPVCYM